MRRGSHSGAIHGTANDDADAEDEADDDDDDDDDADDDDADDFPGNNVASTTRGTCDHTHWRLGRTRRHPIMDRAHTRASAKSGRAHASSAAAERGRASEARRGALLVLRYISAGRQMRGEKEKVGAWRERD
jgi:hypothetical protein